MTGRLRSVRFLVIGVLKTASTPRGHGVRSAECERREQKVLRCSKYKRALVRQTRIIAYNTSCIHYTKTAEPSSLARLSNRSGFPLSFKPTHAQELVPGYLHCRLRGQSSRINNERLEYRTTGRDICGHQSCDGRESVRDHEVSYSVRDQTVCFIWLQLCTVEDVYL